MSVLLHLPHVYFEFWVILRYVFLDQAVGSFLRLAEAGESQRQDIFQLDLLLCRRSRSAFLKYTHFYASAGWKTAFSEPAWPDLENQLLYGSIKGTILTG